jgi:hypothetical protein
MSGESTPCAGLWRLFDADGIGEVLEAKRLCVTCPVKVREACLLRALRFELRAPVKERHGVWGGLSREQRHQIATKGTGHPRAHELRHEALNLAPEDCARCVAAGLEPVAA